MSMPGIKKCYIFKFYNEAFSQIDENYVVYREGEIQNTIPDGFIEVEKFKPELKQFCAYLKLMIFTIVQYKQWKFSN